MDVLEERSEMLSFYLMFLFCNKLPMNQNPEIWNVEKGGVFVVVWWKNEFKNI